MSSRYEHDLGAAFVGVLDAVLTSKLKNRPLSLREVCVKVAGYVAGSRIPDGMEPAYSPHHRSTCHSVAMLGGLLFANQALSKHGITLKTSVLQSVLRGYMTHLGMDATTPYGLPPF